MESNNDIVLSTSVAYATESTEGFSSLLQSQEFKNRVIANFDDNENIVENAIDKLRDTLLRKQHVRQNKKILEQEKRSSAGIDKSGCLCGFCPHGYTSDNCLQQQGEYIDALLADEETEAPTEIPDSFPLYSTTAVDFSHNTDASSEEVSLESTSLVDDIVSAATALPPGVLHDDGAAFTDTFLHLPPLSDGTISYSFENNHLPPGVKILGHAKFDRQKDGSTALALESNASILFAFNRPTPAVKHYDNTKDPSYSTKALAAQRLAQANKESETESAAPTSTSSSGSNPEYSSLYFGSPSPPVQFSSQMQQWSLVFDLFLSELPTTPIPLLHLGFYRYILPLIQVQQREQEEEQERQLQEERGVEDPTTPSATASATASVRTHLSKVARTLSDADLYISREGNIGAFDHYGNASSRLRIGAWNTVALVMSSQPSELTIYVNGQVAGILGDKEKLEGKYTLSDGIFSLFASPKEALTGNNNIISIRKLVAKPVAIDAEAVAVLSARNIFSVWEKEARKQDKQLFQNLSFASLYARPPPVWSHGLFTQLSSQKGSHTPDPALVTALAYVLGEMGEGQPHVIDAVAELEVARMKNTLGKREGKSNGYEALIQKKRDQIFSACASAAAAIAQTGVLLKKYPSVSGASPLALVKLLHTTISTLPVGATALIPMPVMHLIIEDDGPAAEDGCLVFIVERISDNVAHVAVSNSSLSGGLRYHPLLAASASAETLCADNPTSDNTTATGLHHIALGPHEQPAPLSAAYALPLAEVPLPRISSPVWWLALLETMSRAKPGKGECQSMGFVYHSLIPLLWEGQWSQAVHTAEVIASMSANANSDVANTTENIDSDITAAATRTTGTGAGAGIADVAASTAGEDEDEDEGIKEDSDSKDVTSAENKAPTISAASADAATISTDTATASIDTVRIPLRLTPPHCVTYTPITGMGSFLSTLEHSLVYLFQRRGFSLLSAQLLLYGVKSQLLAMCYNDLVVMPQLGASDAASIMEMLRNVAAATADAGRAMDKALAEADAVVSAVNNASDGKMALNEVDKPLVAADSGNTDADVAGDVDTAELAAAAHAVRVGAEAAVGLHALATANLATTTTAPSDPSACGVLTTSSHYTASSYTATAPHYTASVALTANAWRGLSRLYNVLIASAPPHSDYPLIHAPSTASATDCATVSAIGSGELTLSSHNHPLWDKVLDVEDVSALIGDPTGRSSYAPIDITAIPDIVYNVTDILHACRECERVCMSIHVQNAFVKNRDQLRVATLTKLLTRVVPVPHPHASVSEDADAEYGSANGGMRAQIPAWRGGITHAQQVELLLVLKRLTVHAMHAYTQTQTQPRPTATSAQTMMNNAEFPHIHTHTHTAPHAQALVLLMVLAVISDHVLHIQPMDMVNPVATVLADGGFGLGMGVLDTLSETLILTDPALSIARARCLDYISTSAYPRPCFTWVTGEVDAGTYSMLTTIASIQGYAVTHTLNYAFSDNPAYYHFQLNHPELLAYRDILTSLRILCVSQPVIPNVPSDLQHAFLIYYVHNRTVDISLYRTQITFGYFVTPALASPSNPHTIVNTHLLQLHVDSESQDAFTPTPITTEDDILHLKNLPSFGGHVSPANAEVILSILTAPYLRIPMLLEHLSSSDRIHCLQSSMLMQVVFCALFEPGRYESMDMHDMAKAQLSFAADASHTLATTTSTTSTSTNSSSSSDHLSHLLTTTNTLPYAQLPYPTHLLGTRAGLLLNECARNPSALARMCVDLLNAAIGLDTGSPHNTATAILLYIVRVCAYILEYMSWTRAYYAGNNPIYPPNSIEICSGNGKAHIPTLDAAVSEVSTALRQAVGVIDGWLGVLSEDVAKLLQKEVVEEAEGEHGAQWARDEEEMVELRKKNKRGHGESESSEHGIDLHLTSSSSAAGDKRGVDQGKGASAGYAKGFSGKNNSGHMKNSPPGILSYVNNGDEEAAPGAGVLQMLQGSDRIDTVLMYDPNDITNTVTLASALHAHILLSSTSLDRAYRVLYSELHCIHPLPLCTITHTTSAHLPIFGGAQRPLHGHCAPAPLTYNSRNSAYAHYMSYLNSLANIKMVQNGMGGHSTPPSTTSLSPCILYTSYTLSSMLYLQARHSWVNTLPIPDTIIYSSLLIGLSGRLALLRTLSQNVLAKVLDCAVGVVMGQRAHGGDGVAGHSADSHTSASNNTVNTNTTAATSTTAAPLALTSTISTAHLRAWQQLPGPRSNARWATARGDTSPATNAPTPIFAKGDVDIEVDGQTMQLTLRSSHLQALPQAIAQDIVVRDILGEGSLQAAVVELAEHRTWHRIVGRDIDILAWDVDARRAEIFYDREYAPGELYTSEDWISEIFEPIRLTYFNDPRNPTPVYLPEKALSRTACVAHLLIVQARSKSAWKEVFVYKHTRRVDIFDIFSYGRRWFRSLSYTTHARFALRAMQEDYERDKPWPIWGRYEAGEALSQLRLDSHCVVERDAVSNPDIRKNDNISGEKETHLPALVLYGTIPHALLDSHRFWQDESGHVRGYPLNSETTPYLIDVVAVGSTLHDGHGVSKPLAKVRRVPLHLVTQYYDAVNHTGSAHSNAVTTKQTPIASQMPSEVLELVDLDSLQPHHALYDAMISLAFADTWAYTLCWAELGCNDVIASRATATAPTNASSLTFATTTAPPQSAQPLTAIKIIEMTRAGFVFAVKLDPHGRPQLYNQDHPHLYLSPLHRLVQSRIHAVPGDAGELEKKKEQKEKRKRSIADSNGSQDNYDDDQYLDQYNDWEVTEAALPLLTSLLSPLPHALLLQSSQREYAIAVAIFQPQRPRIKGRPLSAELVFAFPPYDQGWLASFASPYLVYPVHSSLEFPLCPTVPSALYLLLLRVLARDYTGARALVDAVATDTHYTAPEALLLSHLAIANSDDSPNMLSLRLHLSHALRHAHVQLPWSLSQTLAAYSGMSAYTRVSAYCRVGVGEELDMLEDALPANLTALALEWVNRPHWGPAPAAIMLHNRREFLRALAASRSGGSGCGVDAWEAGAVDAEFWEDPFRNEDNHVFAMADDDDLNTCTHTLTQVQAHTTCATGSSVATYTPFCPPPPLSRCYMDAKFDISHTSHTSLAAWLQWIDAGAPGSTKPVVLGNSEKNKNSGKYRKSGKGAQKPGKTASAPRSKQSRAALRSQKRQLSGKTSLPHAYPSFRAYQWYVEVEKSLFEHRVSDVVVRDAGTAILPRLPLLYMLLTGEITAKVAGQSVELDLVRLMLSMAPDATHAHPLLAIIKAAVRRPALTKHLPEFLLHAEPVLKGDMGSSGCIGLGANRTMLFDATALIRKAAEVVVKIESSHMGFFSRKPFRNFARSRVPVVIHIDTVAAASACASPHQLTYTPSASASLATSSHSARHVAYNLSQCRWALTLSVPNAARQLIPVLSPADYITTLGKCAPELLDVCRIPEDTSLASQPLSSLAARYVVDIAASEIALAEARVASSSSASAIGTTAGDAAASSPLSTLATSQSPLASLLGYDVLQHPNTKSQVAFDMVSRLNTDLRDYAQQQHSASSAYPSMLSPDLLVRAVCSSTSTNARAMSSALATLEQELVWVQQKASEAVLKARKAVFELCNDTGVHDVSNKHDTEGNATNRTTAAAGAHDDGVGLFNAKNSVVIDKYDHVCIQPDIYTITYHDDHGHANSGTHAHTDTTTCVPYTITATPACLSHPRSSSASSRLSFLLDRLASREPTLPTAHIISSLLSDHSHTDLTRLAPHLCSCRVMLAHTASVMLVLAAAQLSVAAKALVEVTALQMLLSRIVTMIDNKQMYDTTAAFVALSQKARVLATLLTSTRHYAIDTISPPSHIALDLADATHKPLYLLDPRMLVFEYSWSLMLRDSQVDMLTSFTTALRLGQSKVQQLIMGAGKTTVIAPLLALLLTTGKRLVMEVVPPALLQFSASIMRSSFATVIRKPVSVFEFDRTGVLEPADIEKMKHCIRNRGVVLATPTSVKSVLLKYLEVVYTIHHQNAFDAGNDGNSATTSTSTSTSAPPTSTALTTQAHLLRTLLALFRTGVLLVDEVDLVLHPLKSELNFPLGQKLPLDMAPHRWRLAAHVLDGVLVAAKAAAVMDLPSLSPTSRGDGLKVAETSKSDASPQSPPTALPLSLVPPQWRENTHAHSLLHALAHTLAQGKHHTHLQMQPHLVLLNTEWYHTNLKPLLADWLALWLLQAHVNLPMWAVRAYLLEDVAALVDAHAIANVEALERPLGGAGVGNPASSRVGAGVSDGMASQFSSTSASSSVSTTPLPSPSPYTGTDLLGLLHSVPARQLQLLNLSRSWLHAFLPHCLSKYCNVHYGLLSASQTKRLLAADPSMPQSRLYLAVPFIGKDTPSHAAEFAHPDITVGLTLLAYRHQGFRYSDIVALVEGVQEAAASEMGIYAFRPSVVRFREWVEEAGGRIRGEGKSITNANTNTKVSAIIDSTSTDDTNANTEMDGSVPELVSLRLLKRSNHRHMDALYSLLRFSPTACFHYACETIFPTHLRFQRQKLSASGVDLGGSLLFKQRVGFSGTPSSLLPLAMGPCQHQRSADAQVLTLLTDTSVTSACILPMDWSPAYILHMVATAKDENGQPLFRALIDTAALVTGYSNEQVARTLLQQGLEWCDGVVFLGADDRKLVLVRSTGRVADVEQCGVPIDRRFAFYDQVHTTGMDISHSVSARAVLTVGKDMVWRDYAQGAYRMRGIGKGQGVCAVIPPEVAAEAERQLRLIRGGDAVPGGGKASLKETTSLALLSRVRLLQEATHILNPTYAVGCHLPTLRAICTWLLLNSAKSENVQFTQLAKQNAVDAWKHVLVDVAMCSIPPSADASVTNVNGDTNTDTSANPTTVSTSTSAHLPLTSARAAHIAKSSAAAYLSSLPSSITDSLPSPHPSLQPLCIAHTQILPSPTTCLDMLLEDVDTSVVNTLPSHAATHTSMVKAVLAYAQCLTAEQLEIVARIVHSASGKRATATHAATVSATSDSTTTDAELDTTDTDVSIMLESEMVQTAEDEREREVEQEQEREVEMEKFVDLGYSREDEAPEAWSLAQLLMYLQQHSTSSPSTSTSTSTFTSVPALSALPVPFFPASQWNICESSLTLPFPATLHLSRNYYKPTWQGARRLKNTLTYASCHTLSSTSAATSSSPNALHVSPSACDCLPHLEDTPENHNTPTSLEAALAAAHTCTPAYTWLSSPASVSLLSSLLGCLPPLLSVHALARMLLIAGALPQCTIHTAAHIALLESVAVDARGHPVSLRGNPVAGDVYVPRSALLRVLSSPWLHPPNAYTNRGTRDGANTRVENVGMTDITDTSAIVLALSEAQSLRKAIHIHRHWPLTLSVRSLHGTVLAATNAIVEVTVADSAASGVNAHTSSSTNTTATAAMSTVGSLTTSALPSAASLSTTSALHPPLSVVDGQVCTDMPLTYTHLTHRTQLESAMLFLDAQLHPQHANIAHTLSFLSTTTPSQRVQWVELVLCCRRRARTQWRRTPLRDSLLVPTPAVLLNVAYNSYALQKHFHTATRIIRTADSNRNGILELPELCVAAKTASHADASAESIAALVMYAAHNPAFAVAGGSEGSGDGIVDAMQAQVMLSYPLEPTEQGKEAEEDEEENEDIYSIVLPPLTDAKTRAQLMNTWNKLAATHSDVASDKSATDAVTDTAKDSATDAVVLRILQRFRRPAVTSASDVEGECEGDNAPLSGNPHREGNLAVYNFASFELPSSTEMTIVGDAELRPDPVGLDMSYLHLYPHSALVLAPPLPSLAPTGDWTISMEVRLPRLVTTPAPTDAGEEGNAAVAATVSLKSTSRALATVLEEIIQKKSSDIGKNAPGTSSKALDALTISSETSGIPVTVLQAVLTTDVSGTITITLPGKTTPEFSIPENSQFRAMFVNAVITWRAAVKQYNQTLETLEAEKCVGKNAKYSGPSVGRALFSRFIPDPDGHPLGQHTSSLMGLTSSHSARLKHWALQRTNTATGSSASGSGSAASVPADCWCVLTVTYSMAEGITVYVNHEIMLKYHCPPESFSFREPLSLFGCRNRAWTGTPVDIRGVMIVNGAMTTESVRDFCLSASEQEYKWTCAKCGCVYNEVDKMQCYACGYERKE